MKKFFYLMWIAVGFCFLPNRSISQVIDYWDGSVAGSFSSGTGTQADPYVIASGAELAYLASLVNSSSNYGQGMYFELVNDIDLAGKNWTPIGYNFISTAFRGDFEGNGHLIYNLKVVQADTVSAYGLFGRLEGNIRRLGLENVDVTGDFYSGALCSRAVSYSDGVKNIQPHILECYATGSVRDIAQYAGGLVGNVWDGYIENCYSLCSVYGNFHTGGLVAGDLNNSYVTNCYAAGICSHNEDMNAPIGAFVGYLSGSIVNCYYDSQLNAILPGVGDTLDGGSVDLIPIDPDEITATPFPGWSTDIWEFKAGAFPLLRHVKENPVGLSAPVEGEKLTAYLSRNREELYIRSSVPVEYVRMYDLGGKVVLQCISRTVIEIDGLRPGVYIVEAGNRQGSIRTKVVKY